MSIKTPYAPPITHIQYDISIHDFNIAMVNVSVGLAHDIIVDRLISNMRVYMTKKGYVIITNERHNSLTPKLFARKWGISLEV